MQVNESELRAMIRRVVEQMQQRQPRQEAGVGGIFDQLDDAVAAARRAHEQLAALSREKRGELIAAIRAAGVKHALPLAELAVQETRMGRVQDKAAEHRLVATKTPGIEDIETHAWSGDHGLTTVEMAPFGVIGSIAPVTNPVATIVNNSIGMIAAGNAVTFCPHPSARLTSVRTVELLNQAILEAGGPPNLLTSVAQPTIEVAQNLMQHKGINMLVVTGGPAVVRLALQSGKKAIGAGAGNPPAVVDPTCDIQKAGRDLILGASLDNNLPCIAEKSIIAVDAIADALVQSLVEHGAVRLSPSDAEAVTECVVTGDGGQGARGCSGKERVLAQLHVKKEFVGQPAAAILKAAGVPVSGDPRLAFMEVDAGHPLVWLEQMMPIIPIVRVRDVQEAIRFAVEVEQGRKHTATIWSRNVETMTQLARAIQTTIFVKNGPSYAGLGLGGEGYPSFTIAGPTGEGLTSARNFTRRRRCTLVDAFSIV